jgi:hypothetical protein
MAVRAIAVAAVIGLAATSAGAGTGDEAMADREGLARAWVEVAEESAGERIVLRPADSPLPPSRGGRRRLDLKASGLAEQLGYGPTDSYETKASGTWTLEGKKLRLELKDWQGVYLIEELGDEILVLRRR